MQELQEADQDLLANGWKNNFNKTDMNITTKDYLKEKKDLIDSIVNRLVEVYGIEVEPCIRDAVEISFSHGYNKALDKVVKKFPNELLEDLEQYTGVIHP